jgi:putative transposase
LETSKTARSSYYYNVKRLGEKEKYEKEKGEIIKIFNGNKGRYGYRRVTVEMKNKGYKLNHKTVQRLMKEMGIKSKVRKRRYNSYKVGNENRVAENILNRQFKASRPNEKWVTDITEFSLFGEKLYLSTILDLYNGEIITYEIKRRPVFDLVLETVKKAINKKRKEEKVILHSDQGWHYRMEGYQKLLGENEIVQSMSRKGNCLDNAVMENFFGHIKSELLYIEKFRSMEHFISELKEYIDYYNNKRIKIKLNGLSPVHYRIQSSLSA